MVISAPVRYVTIYCCDFFISLSYSAQMTSHGLEVLHYIPLIFSNALSALHSITRMPSNILPRVGLILWLTLTSVIGKTVVTQMSPNVIDTQFGKLRGVLVTLQNQNLGPVELYLGIQYATLLGGELRFMPPTSSMEKWDGIRVALRFRPVCPQRIPDIEDMKRRMPLGRVEHFKRIIPFLEQQAEDCLNLNLYVPVRDSTKDSDSGRRLYPVVVFVHGESFEFGTGNAYDGSVIASYGRVIVMTLNYRLGVLGFLSTGDGNSPGNYALLDLVAALHWIKENVASFGGDAESVTLMGHGYGGCLVNLLMISPVAKGRNLFQKAIIQSGGALSSWSMITDAWSYTLQLSAFVNCTSPIGPTPSAASIMRCLKHVPLEALTAVDIRAPKYFSILGPTVDYRSVLPFSLRRLMLKPTQSIFSSVKLMLGFTNNEGLHFFNQSLIERGITETQRTRMLRTYVHNVYTYNKQYLYDVLDHQYSDWDKASDSKALRDGLMELLSDGQYVAPVIELARLHARLNSATYLYAFNYAAHTDTHAKWMGASHGDELMFVFGAPLTDGIDPFPSTYSNTDRLMSETLLNHWTNFIRNGDPNQPGVNHISPGGMGKDQSKTLPQWPQYDLTNQYLKYFAGDPKSSQILHHYRGSKVALWLDLIPRLHKADSLESRYHLLDNSFNSSTFDSEGTRPILLDDINSTPIPTTEPTDAPEPLSPLNAAPSIVAIIDSSGSSAASKTGDRQRLAERNGSGGLPRGRTATLTEVTTKSAIQVVESNSPAASGRKHDDKEETGGGYLTLTLTVIIGCSLLLLNIGVFTAVFIQRDKVRRERRLVKLELEREREMRLCAYTTDDRRALNNSNHVKWADDSKSNCYRSPFCDDSPIGALDPSEVDPGGVGQSSMQYATVPRRLTANHSDPARQHSTLDNGRAVKYIPLESPSSDLTNNRTSSFNPSTVV